MNRKNFLLKTAIGTSGIISLPLLSFVKGMQQQKPDPLPADKVKEFVIAGHGNFDKTKQRTQRNKNEIITIKTKRHD